MDNDPETEDMISIITNGYIPINDSYSLLLICDSPKIMDSGEVVYLGTFTVIRNT